jgi:hypothetical protein
MDSLPDRCGSTGYRDESDSRMSVIWRSVGNRPVKRPSGKPCLGKVEHRMLGAGGRNPLEAARWGLVIWGYSAIFSAEANWDNQSDYFTLHQEK